MGLELTPCASIDEALDMVERGEAAYAAFSISHTHDLSDVYLRFYKRDLYLNRSYRPYVTDSDRRYFVLSKKLTRTADCNRMSLAFAVKRSYGSLTQTLSTLAEAKLNIENMRLRRSIPGDGHPDDLIFIDPPSAMQCAADAVERLLRAELIAKGALVVLELGEEEPDFTASPFLNFEVQKLTHYGKKTTVAILFFRGTEQA
jgi:16S rRNA G966 N2-methylase RsmD